MLFAVVPTETEKIGKVDSKTVVEAKNFPVILIQAETKDQAWIKLLNSDLTIDYSKCNLEAVVEFYPAPSSIN